AAEEAGRRAEALRHRAWEITHRVTGIEHELARHAAALDQVATLLPLSALAGQVSDFLHPRPTDAALLDRVWHDLLELPAVRVDELPPDAVKTAVAMEARIRLAFAGAGDPPAPPEPVEGAEPLFPLAGIADEDAAWLAAVLPPAYRAHDAATARRLAESNPRAVFLAPDGTLYRGRTAELPSAGSRLRGALELRSELEALTRELEELEAQADAAQKLEGEHTEAAAALEEQLAGLNHALLQAEEARARAAAIERSAQEELGRLERELDAISAEAERNRREQAAIEAKREKLKAEVKDLEERSAAVELALDKAGTTVEARREEEARAVRELDRFEAEERLAAERVEAARAEAVRLSGELRALQARRSELDQKVHELQDRLTTTQEEVVRSRTRLAEEQGLLAGARERERQAAEAVGAVSARVGALEKEVGSRRATHEQVRGRLHEIEVDETRIEAEWEKLCEGAGSDLGLAPEAFLDERAEGDASEETLQAEVDALRAKLDRTGPVNLLAVQEAGELDQRSAFLHDQREDLLKSLASLNGTIREIDATCTERFIDTFEKVNGMFAETFSHLFGGGTARLDLADEDDPLESGVLITAQPPGKKNQSVQLLSGGERALAALSLLIALFRIKPSPVCILDEVDASLDGANIVRLMELVRDMTGETQFVLITHNRRTMMGAEVLYGVTMERPGVSKIISVRMEG
ncbi:MAG: AAA family ATPase, partial [Acidobacteria bacterium]|nr:AAA family ATPase [Acidobacteriota bacterium]